MKNWFKKKEPKPYEEQIRDHCYEFCQKNFPKMIKKFIAQLDTEKDK